MATKSKPAKIKKLTPQQTLFCYLYVSNGGNIYQAAIGADYSKNYAKARSHELLEHVGMGELVAKLIKEALKEEEMDAKEYIQILTRILRTNIDDVVSWNKSGMVFLNDSDDLDPRHAPAIESVQVEERVTPGEDDSGMILKTKVKMVSKAPFAKMMGEILKVLNDKAGDINLNGPITIEVVRYGKKGEE